MDLLFSQRGMLTRKTGNTQTILPGREIAGMLFLCNHIKAVGSKYIYQKEKIMKIKSLLMFVLLSLVASVSMAAGYHSTGFVYVTNSTTSTSYMYGTMNVRYNTASSTYSEYIYGTHSAGGSVTFSGRDGDGDYFYCYVPSTATLYDQAVDIANNLTNGAYLYVTKTSSSSDCSYVYLNKASYYLD